MNSKKRLLLGIVSSLLLAVGFAKAANHLDPMTLNLHGSVGGQLQDGPNAPCEGDPDDEN